MYSEVFYYTVFKVGSSLRVACVCVLGREKWMTIPDMGYRIASRYSVIFVSSSWRFNINLFPLLVFPFMSTSLHKLTIVSFIKNSYWIQVKLKLNCPFPPFANHWRQNYSVGARAWETSYTRHIRH